MTETENQQPVLAEISKDGDRVNVTFPYNPAHVRAIKQVPSARFVPKDKPDGPCWRLNLDMPTMRRLREAVGDALRLGDELRVWGAKQVELERNLTDLSQADDAELENVPARMVKGCKRDGRQFKLRPYQKADIKFMANTNVINANQPGAGKTIETICAMFEAGLEWGQHLVFAPVASLRNVWEQELKEAYACAGYDEPTILTGDTPDQRREAVATAKELADEGYAFWLVLNPAMARLKKVRTLDGQELSKGELSKLSIADQNRTENEEVLVSPQLTEIEWDSITIDEFHLMGLSNPVTLGARGVNQIAEITQPAKRYALSGTPMGGKPVKLWGALHFLEPNKFTSRWHWARHWLVINTNGYGSAIEGIMPGREVDFYEHLKPYLVRRTKREALPGLPPKQQIDVWCGMSSKQRAQYIQFATEAEWRMDDAEESGRLTAANILAEYTRLKQFAGAYCTVKKTGKERAGVPVLEVRHTDDSGKIAQLVEKLKEENVIGVSKDDDDKLKCAIVYSQFNSLCDAVTEVLRENGVPVAQILSGKDKANKAVIDSFKEQGPDSPRVLVMNTAMGTALTLTQADTAHILDETWVPDNQEQAEDRIHRGDDLTMAKDEIRIYYYRTRGSIEEYIQRLVADKQMNNRTILDLRRRMQKELAKAEAEAEEGEAA
jgi:SNF2 family DNA or RNA helicase